MDSLMFTIPYLPDDNYIEFINNHKDNLESVYFPLNSKVLSTARVDSSVVNMSDDVYEDKLSKVKVDKKYILVNSRYNSFLKYDPNMVNHVTSRLRKLYESNLVTGIIFLDFYYLRLLYESDPQLMVDLDVIPSSNCMIDNEHKLESYLNYIDSIGLRYPSKIIIDRILNRELKSLETFSNYVRTNYDFKIETVVNEGCLYNCPFKVNHDISISLVSDQTIVGINYLNNLLNTSSFKLDHLNLKYGCIDIYSTDNHVLLSSPFVRPEDLKYIEDYVDIVKISGRNLGSEFLMNTFNSYLERSHIGNLIEILDSFNVLQSVVYINNSQLPDDFYKVVSSCNKNCRNCNYCKDIIKKVGN